MSGTGYRVNRMTSQLIIIDYVNFLNTLLGVMSILLLYDLDKFSPPSKALTFNVTISGDRASRQGEVGS